MRWVVTIVGILVIVGVLAAVKGAQVGRLVAHGKRAEAEGPPPEVVSSSVAREQRWEGTLDAIGSVTTARGVALAADVPGVVNRIHFESGATAVKGQALVELDASVERAELAAAIARRDLAHATIARTRALAKSGAISTAELDAGEAALRTATVEVEGIRAQIAKKTIRAPFAGRLGLRAVNLGQYLEAGTPVTVLETLDAVKVDFTLPQQHLADVAVGMPVRIHVEGEGDAGAAEGRLAAVDPTVDPVTRTIKLRADITGHTEGLRPGMFVEVAVVLPKSETIVAVPATALVRAPYGDSVFVVEDKAADEPGRRETPDGRKVKTARQQFVKVGRARGDFVSIEDGLAPSEEVVSAGGFKLRNGAPIVVDEAKRLEPQLAPRPENR